MELLSDYNEHIDVTTVTIKCSNNVVLITRVAIQRDRHRKEFDQVLL